MLPLGLGAGAGAGAAEVADTAGAVVVLDPALANLALDDPTAAPTIVRTTNMPATAKIDVQTLWRAGQDFRGG